LCGTAHLYDFCKYFMTDEACKVPNELRRYADAHYPVVSALDPAFTRFRAQFVASVEAA
jgi:hypothetical protein